MSGYCLNKVIQTMEPVEIEYLFTILFVACTSPVNLEEIWAQETRVQGRRRGR